MPQVRDAYANMAIMRVVESAANTLTFAKLESATSLFEKVGYVIHEIHYHTDITFTGFNANEDTLTFGLAVSNGITDVTAARSEVIDSNKITRVDAGAAAVALFTANPYAVKRFDLPGGGLLVPPNPLYLFAQGVSLVNAATVIARIFYSVIQLKPEEYWELVEMRRILGTA